MMFAEMAIGYGLCKFKVLKPQDRSILSKMVISILLPCNIINSFNIEFSMKILSNFIEIFLASCGILLLSMIISRVAYTRFEESHKPVLQYATLCSNSGFLGNAVAEGVYGAEGMMYGQIYLIPVRIIMWSAGVSYFAGTKGKKGVWKSVLTHPCIIATIIGIIRMLFQIPFPAAVNSLLSAVGKCTTPITMIFLGMIMAESGFKKLFSKLTLYYTVIRLVIIPVLTMVPCILLKLDPMVAGLSVLLAAMPAGSTTAVLAEQYNVDVEFAASCVVLTTLLSIALLPLWVYIIGVLL